MLGAAGAALLLTGCGNENEQTSLHPASHATHDIATLFWWMTGIAWGGLGLVVALLFVAWKRRNRRGADPKTGERRGWYVVVGAGIVMPIALITALFVVSDLFVIRTTEAPAANETRLTVLVVGHQWWWEVRYPGTRAVTANEIHIPVRTPVRLEVRTADVIHSFWVPELNRKIDTIPGKTNVIELDALAAGVYRGQCAEFCGLQHAHMGFEVVAQPAPAFRRWLATQRKPAELRRRPAAQAGERAFVDGSCAQLPHDPRHLGERLRRPGPHPRRGPPDAGGATIPNTPAYLAGWISDSQAVKPGNRMPEMTLTDRQLRDLVAYLDELR